MVIYTNFKGMRDAEVSLNNVKVKFSEEMDAMDAIVSETTLRDWKGPDADAFVNSVTEKMTKLRTEYEEYFTSLKNEINANANKFKDVQQKNINMID